MSVANISRLSPTRRSFFARPHARLGLGFVIGLVMLLIVGLVFISANWPYRYRKIHPLLEDVLSSQVKVYQYHRTYFPNPGFVAIGLTLRR